MNIFDKETQKKYHLEYNLRNGAYLVYETKSNKFIFSTYSKKKAIYMLQWYEFRLPTTEQLEGGQ